MFASLLILNTTRTITIEAYGKGAEWVDSFNEDECIESASKQEIRLYLTDV